MKFKGDIIITDPCYIDTKDYKLWDYKGDEFDIFTGNGLDMFGFTKWIWKDTLYGDWNCGTFDSKTKKRIGSFCADAGLVGVFLLDEILKFNPEYNDHIEKPYSATLIKDFDGEIEYKISEKEEAYIEGKGNINFITSQTGF